MSPTPEISERQRKAAFKAWETIRKKKAGAIAKDKTIILETQETATKKKTISRESAYPKNWKQIVAEIRERARNVDGLEQCECRGECLKHDDRCQEINHTWPKHRRSKGKVTIRLTIAHLCHTPECEDKSHLRAMCEPCHLIFDLRCRQRSLRGGNSVRWAMQRGLGKTTNEKEIIEAAE